MALNNKRLLICLICLIVVGITLCTIINYKKNNPQQVEKSKCEIVRTYISQTYNMDGKVIASWYSYDLSGFTGGLYMYTFKVKDSDGKIFFIKYSSYIDLSEETITNLKLENKK